MLKVSETVLLEDLTADSISKGKVEESSEDLADARNSNRRATTMSASPPPRCSALRTNPAFFSPIPTNAIVIFA